MRSALFGLPILTPKWLKSCFHERRIITAPTGDMCIRSLPRKTPIGDETLASYGVAKYAAVIANTDCKILSNCSVVLCGKWKATGQSIMKDVKMLLNDAGASIIDSAAASSALLVDISHDDNSTKHFVFLCDDSHVDADCGVSESLYQAGKDAISRAQNRVLAVHFHWLFDCVSCARFLPGLAYEPISPRTKELWRLSCASNDG
jgi:hypothetical protein